MTAQEHINERIALAKQRAKEWDDFVAQEQAQVKAERIQAAEHKADAALYLSGPGIPEHLEIDPPDGLISTSWSVVNTKTGSVREFSSLEKAQAALTESEDDEDAMPWADRSDLVKADQEKIHHRLNLIAGNLTDMEALNLEESRLVWEHASQEIRSLVAAWYRNTHNLSTKSAES